MDYQHEAIATLFQPDSGVESGGRNLAIPPRVTLNADSFCLGTPMKH
ncbi:MAG: hypothetical protein QOJ51_4998 [Acidobacteriaceae bacterium]|jgi:hypothetical protein|nr:hypothetical protein [Acidobacteriaceae bacterium]